MYEDCEENFCLNGATCQIAAGEYLCICSERFTGTNCSKIIMFFKNKMQLIMFIGIEIIDDSTSNSVTSPTPSPTDANNDQSDKSIVIAGSIVGIIIFAFAFIVALITTACLIKKKMEKKKGFDSNIEFVDKRAFDGHEKYEIN